MSAKLALNCFVVGALMLPVSGYTSNSQVSSVCPPANLTKAALPCKIKPVLVVEKPLQVNTICPPVSLTKPVLPGKNKPVVLDEKPLCMSNNKSPLTTNPILLFILLINQHKSIQ